MVPKTHPVCGCDGSIARGALWLRALFPGKNCWRTRIGSRRKAGCRSFRCAALPTPRVQRGNGVPPFLGEGRADHRHHPAVLRARPGAAALLEALPRVGGWVCAESPGMGSMLKSCELSSKPPVTKAAVRSACANSALVGRRLFVVKNRSCALWFHTAKTSRRNRGASNGLCRHSRGCCCVSFSILRSQAANQGLPSRGGLFCRFTISPVTLMLRFLTEWHKSDTNDGTNAMLINM